MTVSVDRIDDVGGAVKKVVSTVIGVDAGLEVSMDELILGSLDPARGDKSDFYSFSVEHGKEFTIGLNKVPGASDRTFDPKIVLWHPDDGWRASNDDVGSYRNEGDFNARLDFKVQDFSTSLIVEVTSIGYWPSGNYQLFISEDGNSVPFSAVEELSILPKVPITIVDPEKTGGGGGGIGTIGRPELPPQTTETTGPSSNSNGNTLPPEIKPVVVQPPEVPPAAGHLVERETSIQGSEAVDIISATGRDDVIYTYGGDDVIYANGLKNGTGLTSEFNRIDAGSGNDRIFGSDGNDEINAGSGDDMVQANGGDDILNGRSGTDQLSYAKSTGGIAMDFRSGTVTGADGNDIIGGFENAFGSSHNDRMIADELDNEFNGYHGDDVIAGMGGNDTLLGGDGDDVLVAHASRFGGGRQSQEDYLDGGRGDDKLYGGSGKDLIVGGDGNDELTGHFGEDTFVFNRGEAGHDSLLDFEAGTDHLVFAGLKNVDLSSGEQGLVIWYGDDASVTLIGVQELSTDLLEFA